MSFPVKKYQYFIEYVKQNVFGEFETHAHNISAESIGKAQNDFNHWHYCQFKFIPEIVKVEKL